MVTLDALTYRLQRIDYLFNCSRQYWIRYLDTLSVQVMIPVLHMVKHELTYW